MDCLLKGFAVFKRRKKAELPSKPFQSGMLLPNAPHPMRLFEMYPGGIKELTPDSPYYDWAGDEIIMDEDEL